MRKLLYFLFLLSLGCSHPENSSSNQPLFELVPSAESGFEFFNGVTNSQRFNIFSYRNFYNGGGVAIGDINNDGLADIYMTANQGPNKLFLNKGDFKFEDITNKAGVAGNKGWSTGVVFVDINADGFLDIYVCNAGYVEGDDQKNELFINNQDGTFSEKAAQYQLDDSGYTTHAAFFDYDLDGDLDVYILNNSFIPVNTLNYINKRNLAAEDWPVRDFLKGGGDKLLRNDNGIFLDVTKEAGIFSSLIGFGLGVTVGDVNGDGWLDMYISNDFFERDYLYINNQDGTFAENLEAWMQHLSLSSMGADMADINNDGYPEIFVTEMLPASDYRRKTTTMFESYNTYLLKTGRDFYHQYMHNTLQLNNKDETFSEIAWYSGVAASDWSWGALMFDADNDGYRDIYVCNGVYQDVTDQDFINFFANEVIQKMVMTGDKEEVDSILKRMPSNPQLNSFFHNNKDLTFTESGQSAGFDLPSFSNGAAYGDLDNDGDLDLVVNNLNQESFLYRNQANPIENNHFLRVRLEGPSNNPFAVGAKVSLYAAGQIFSNQLVPSRGFQSSVDYQMVFGLGKISRLDSVQILWPDLKITTVQPEALDTGYTFQYENAFKRNQEKEPDPKLASAFLEEMPLAAVRAHAEDEHYDFLQEGLVIKMLSREGPAMAVADINGDGADDLFLGGASGQFSTIYFQTNGRFDSLHTFVLEDSKDFEDTEAVFFDADSDGDLDLLVGSGGNHKPAGSPLMQDRLYLNQGNGTFRKSGFAIPPTGFNTSSAVPFDLDGDGDLDIFLGSRSNPGVYGIPPRSFLLQNDGRGNFKDITGDKAPFFHNLGMVTDACIADLDGNGKSELIITGEWMAPKVFSIQDGVLAEFPSNLSEYKGWWYTAAPADLDGDGDLDLVLGNRGENFYFSGSPEKPAKLWLGDFDNNGTVEKILTQNIDGKDMPLPMKAELTEQLVSLKKQNLKHTEYASKSIQQLFPKNVLDNAAVLEANFFKSVIAYNDGKGNFEILPLPREIQFSCVCGVQCVDVNKDDQLDIILGGNDANFMPQYSRLDANFGSVLINQGNKSFKVLNSLESGLQLQGDVRQLKKLEIAGKQALIFGLNNQRPKLYSINNGNQPGKEQF